MKTARRRYSISPYMKKTASLMLVGLTIAILGLIWIAVEKGKDSYIFDALLSPDAVATYCLLIMYIGVISTYIWNGFEYFGKLEITSDSLIFTAIFHPRIVFKYDEIRDLGIDYGHLPQGKQYWIYFSASRLDYKYCHRINRVPFSADCMRIEYRSDVYSALLNEITDKRIKKILQAANNNVVID